ncbi:cobalamin biosynthesis protein [Ectothiorhodospira marina]|nr:cobalamin biosynthesis protein [Ectothiorhodospira marina]
MPEHDRPFMTGSGALPRRVLGLGCQQGISLETLRGALQEALAQVGADMESVMALATFEARARESAITTLSLEQGWPLYAYTAEALAGVTVSHPSERLRHLTGTPSVSEAAAILASGAQAGDMILEKYVYRGADGGYVTVSIVELNPMCANKTP